MTSYYSIIPFHHPVIARIVHKQKKQHPAIKVFYVFSPMISTKMFLMVFPPVFPNVSWFFPHPICRKIPRLASHLTDLVPCLHFLSFPASVMDSPPCLGDKSPWIHCNGFVGKILTGNPWLKLPSNLMGLNRLKFSHHPILWMSCWGLLG